LIAKVVPHPPLQPATDRTHFPLPVGGKFPVVGEIPALVTPI
jgi:hypothetical protein